MGFHFMGPNLGNPALRALQHVMVDGVQYRVRQTDADPVHECVLVEFTPVAVVAEIIGKPTTTDLVALHGPDPFVGRVNRAALVASDLDLYEALAELIRGDRVAYQRGPGPALRPGAGAGSPHGARVRARRRAARALTGASDHATLPNQIATSPPRAHDEHGDVVVGIWEQATQPTVWPSWGFIALVVLLGVGALLFELWAARA
jgi:hypothetical protein